MLPGWVDRLGHGVPCLPIERWVQVVATGKQDAIAFAHGVVSGRNVIPEIDRKGRSPCPLNTGPVEVYAGPTRCGGAAGIAGYADDRSSAHLLHNGCVSIV